MRVVRYRSSLVGLLLLALAIFIGTAGVAAQQPKIIVAEEIKLVDGAPQPFPITISPDQSLSKGGWIAILMLDAPLIFSSGSILADREHREWRVSQSDLDGLTVSAKPGMQGQWLIVVGLLDQRGELLATTSSSITVESSHTELKPSAASELLASSSSPAKETDRREARGLEDERRQAEGRRAADEARRQTEARQEAASKLGVAERLVSRGEQQLALGNVALAREFFKRAADVGLPGAALLMGDTFVAAELARHGVIGIRPDPDEAARWYEKARELGAAAAATQRLERLKTR